MYTYICKVCVTHMCTCMWMSVGVQVCMCVKARGQPPVLFLSHLLF